MKNKAITTMILFLAGIFIVAFGVVLVVGTPDDSIVGLWHFDEGIGSTAADSSGYGHDGILSGGKFGNALDFDGVDDYVSVLDSHSLDCSSAITIEAWIYLENYPSIQSGSILSKRWAYYFVLSPSGKLNAYTYGTTPQIWFSSVTSVPLNEWTHVAFTYDGGTIKIYINGELDVSSPRIGNIAITEEWAAIGRVGIKGGAEIKYGPRAFDGIIDEVRISNVARTTFGLAAPPSDDADTVALWHFDESVSSTAYDETANTNDGTFYEVFWAGPTWSNEAKFDGALEFDGFDDYVLMADPGDPNNLDGFTGLTLAAWINPDAVSDLFSRAIISKYDTKNAWASYYLSLWEDEIRVFVGESKGKHAWKTTDSADLTAGSWVHVAGTWDGSEFKLYVNGTEKTGASTIPGVFPGSMLDSTIQVDLGAFEAKADGVRFGFFDGKIDDAQIYNRALHSYEIIALATAGVEVGIDIKPGSDPNSINLGEHGLLPVAILGSDSFEVTTINPFTIEIGDLPLATRGGGSKKQPKLAYSYEDVNEDGYIDLMAFFDVQEMVNSGILTGTTAGLMLTAKLDDETPIKGIDSVNIVPQST